MNFKISREALLKPLQMVSGVVEKRQTLPILANVLIEIRGQRMMMTGTDLEVELKAQCLPEQADEGETTLPARKFADICRTLPEGAALDVLVEEDKATIRSGRSRFTLAVLGANEFPSSDSVTGGIEFSLEQHLLKNLIERTQFCMANQDVRYYLNGMLLEVDRERIRAVATDGHRLAVSDVQCNIDTSVKHQVIVPRKGINELARLLSDNEAPCIIRLNSNQIRFDLEGVVLTSKLIDGRFPDYERVIPKGSSRVVIADRAVLRQAFSRAAILSNEKYRGIRLILGAGQLKALVNNPDQEEAEEQVEVEYQGEEFEIGFNVNYLVDALDAISAENVSLGMTDGNSSCLLNGVGDETSRYVVMPMRL